MKYSSQNSARSVFFEETMNKPTRNVGLIIFLLTVFYGLSCHGGENPCGNGSGNSQGTVLSPVPGGVATPRAGTRTPGAKIRDNALRFLMIKDPAPEVLEEERLQRELVNINDARFRTDPSQPPVDISGNVVEGWDMSTVKMSPRNITRYLKGLPPIK